MKMKDRLKTNIPLQHVEKSLTQKREEMKSETWIKNVMRIYGWDRVKADMEYRRIFYPFLR